MRICPVCHERFDDAYAVCPRDGAALPFDEADARIGTVIMGQFELLEICGRGATGAVYRAWQTGMERQVAIKVLRAELMRDRETVARFDREARAVAKLQHPNIVTFFLVGNTAEGLPFLAMEYVEGQALSEVAEQLGIVDTARVLHIARQITSALSEAHAEGIVHRDLKPANILLTHRRRMPDFVKVLDFGIAKILGREGDAREDMESRLTRTGAIFGTPHYISPEQASGGDVDHRADLYSLGVILYRLLTGRLPFEGAGIAVMLAHVGQAVVPPSQLVPGMDPRLEALILRALEKEPARRFQSAEEMADALDAAGATRPTVRTDEALAATSELSPSSPTPLLVPKPDGEAAPAPALRDLPPPLSRELAVDPRSGDTPQAISSTTPAPAPRRGFAKAFLGLALVASTAAGAAWFFGRSPATQPDAPTPPPGDPAPAAALPSSTPPSTPTAAAPIASPPATVAPEGPAIRTITLGEEGFAIRSQVPKAPRQDVDYTLVFDVLDPSGAPLGADNLGLSIEDPDDVEADVEAPSAGPGHYVLRRAFARAGRYHVHVFPVRDRKGLHIWFDLLVTDAEGKVPPEPPRVAHAPARPRRPTVPTAPLDGAAAPEAGASSPPAPSPTAPEAPAVPAPTTEPPPATPPPVATEDVHEGAGASDPYHDGVVEDAPPEPQPEPQIEENKEPPPAPLVREPTQRRNRFRRPRPTPHPNPDGLE